MADRVRRVSRIAGIFILGVFLLLLMLTPLFQVRPSGHAAADLKAASAYVAVVPEKTRVPMFADNQPLTRISGDKAGAIVALDAIKRLRPGRYRAAWGRANIDVVILDDFLVEALLQRQER